MTTGRRSRYPGFIFSWRMNANADQKQTDSNFASLNDYPRYHLVIHGIPRLIHYRQSLPRR